jgi:hypothetical protein
MSIEIHPPGDYVAEIFRTWGLHDLARDVWIVPATAKVDAGIVEARARHGAVVIVIMPDPDVAKVAGLKHIGPRDLPAHLRFTGFIPRGLAGELIPIVGAAGLYELAGAPTPLAYLCDRMHCEFEAPGIVDMPVGAGRVIAITFDLPRCVWMLRQGDPAREGTIPEGDSCERPSHMACEIEAGEAGWCPYADLLARSLIELIERGASQPVPLVHHLPGAAPSLLLYSGDEDNLPVADNDDQMRMITARGGRMDLYIIPDETQSTADDIRRYARHNDLGPHPNLLPCSGKSVAERLSLLKSQINRFREISGIEPLTVRNHCTAWVGYMQHVEALEHCGVRMETSYNSDDYLRGRRYAPYNAFGAAMPMRFARTDGSMINVYQQHTHYMDNILLYTGADYSYNFTTEAFAVMADRACRDACVRYRTPLGADIHPGNRPKFSRDADTALLDTAARHGMPVWSFTQWCRFWIDRETCVISDVRWDGSVLSLAATAGAARDDLRIALPPQGLEAVTIDGTSIGATPLAPLTEGRHRIKAVYRRPA